MKSKAVMILVLAAIFLSFCFSLSAHHGNSAYDTDKTVSVKATITKFEFVNPHVQIYYDVADEKGNIEHWVAESHNPAMLTRGGWNRNSLKPGDQVTLVVNPNKVGAKVVFLEKIVFPDGRVLEAKTFF